MSKSATMARSNFQPFSKKGRTKSCRSMAVAPSLARHPPSKASRNPPLTSVEGAEFEFPGEAVFGVDHANAAGLVKRVASFGHRADFSQTVQRHGTECRFGVVGKSLHDELV